MDMSTQKRTSTARTSIITQIDETIASINTPQWTDSRRTREEQLRRLRSVISRELTQNQRETLIAVMEGKQLIEIAKERGVNCSTVCRTYHRALDRLKRFTRY